MGQARRFSELDPVNMWAGERKERTDAAQRVCLNHPISPYKYCFFCPLCWLLVLWEMEEWYWPILVAGEFDLVRSIIGIQSWPRSPEPQARFHAALPQHIFATTLAGPQATGLARERRKAAPLFSCREENPGDRPDGSPYREAAQAMSKTVFITFKYLDVHVNSISIFALELQMSWVKFSIL